MNDTTPALNVYSFVARQGEPTRTDDSLREIGRAILHPDRRGYSVHLQALPTNTTLILREEESAESEAGREHTSLNAQLEAFERAVIEQCLMENGGKVNAVMARLDVPRRTLTEKMSRLGIDRRRFVRGGGAKLEAR